MNNTTDDQDVNVIEGAREEVVEAMARSADIYGLKRSYGRLYGILFFADEPLSLDELVDESEYAKSTVSTAMQKMNRLHLVHRRSIPGEGKKVFYEAETDLWHVLQEVLQHEVQREIDIMMRALNSAETRLEEVDDKDAQADLEKIRSLRRLYVRSERVVEFLTSNSMDRLGEFIDRLRRTE